MLQGSSNAIILTSPFSSLLHAVLVNVQCEQHVGVPSLVLINIRSAGAPGSNGCIQEEGGFLSSWGTKLTLVLKLKGGKGKPENKVRVSEKGLMFKRKRDREKREREGNQLIGLCHTFLAH